MMHRQRMRQPCVGVGVRQMVGARGYVMLGYWEAQPLCTDVVLRWPHAGRSACWQVECRAYSISEYWNVQPQLRPNANSGGSGGRARYRNGTRSVKSCM
jgi:hypothetical protein